MELEYTCCEISLDKWNDLMNGAKPINYDWLKNKIRKHLPNLYKDLCLDFGNPYGQQSKVTKTHYILVHSAIEYFIKKF
jgi:hypothetical protein